MDNVIEEVYTAERSRLCKKVRNRVGGPVNAEDVVQEAFTRALQYQDSYNPEFKSLDAWLGTILNNAGRDFKKAERRQGMSAGTSVDYETNTLEEDAIRTELVHRVLEDMAVSSYSEILRLYFLLGYTPKEISEVLEQAPQSISNAVQRFKNEMKEKYDEDVRW